MIDYWTVNAHGMEGSEYEIPKNVKIITFCYTGRKLQVCEEFDLFNWNEIFLNTSITSSFTNFLKIISKYSSIKDHFCVYEEGHTIRDIIFTEKKSDLFRQGVYKLPILASVKIKDTTYVSSEEVFPEAIKAHKNKRIILSKQICGDFLKEKEKDEEKEVVNIYSSYIENFGRVSMSELIKNLKKPDKGLVFLLFTCREGERRRGVIHPKKVKEYLNELRV